MLAREIIRTGLGQDSHRFVPEGVSKPCILGGVIFDGCLGLLANSDGDVVLHAICNAISSLTGVLILGGVADQLCLKEGITDSRVYVKEALKTLGKQKINHVAISIEALKPRFKEKIPAMRASIAELMNLDLSQVGITATTGEGLTDFGCGDGVQAFVILTTAETL